jgi:hypothetical protein
MNPAAVGLAAGVIHHFSVQYPNQASMLTTFYSFAMTNTIFVILLLGPEDAIQLSRIGRLLKDFMIFELVYVSHPFRILESNGFRVLLHFS